MPAPPTRPRWFQIELRCVLIAILWLTISLAGYKWLIENSMRAGAKSSFFVAFLCVVAMPLGISAAIGAIFGKWRWGAVVGLCLGLLLAWAAFFWVADG